MAERFHWVRFIAVALTMALFGIGCSTKAPPSATDDSSVMARATSADDDQILISQGPVILQTPGLPTIVIRTPQDPPSAPLSPEILADPDLTTITVPTGTRITRNVDGDPRALKIRVDRAHDKDYITVISKGNLNYSLDMRSDPGPVTTGSDQDNEAPSPR